MSSGTALERALNLSGVQVPSLASQLWDFRQVIFKSALNVCAGSSLRKVVIRGCDLDCALLSKPCALEQSRATEVLDEPAAASAHCLSVTSASPSVG